MANRTSQSLARILQDAESLSLVEIRLLECHSKLGALRKDGLPTVGTETTGMSLRHDVDTKSVIVTVAFRLAINYDGSEDSDPALFLSARYGLHYRVSEPTARKHLEAVIKRVALLNVWPYWRELVQSLTVRMGLPAFPMPLLSKARLVKNKKSTEEADGK